MAASTVNGEVSAILDEVSKPPDGVVLPPKDIRAIVETTAGYVARNGGTFEDRIVSRLCIQSITNVPTSPKRDKEKFNAKFSFLAPNDAYSPYYAWRLSEIRQGRGTAVSAGRVGEAQVPAEAEKPKGPAPPPEFSFSARMPNISAQDLDVVKLTALFVAKNGRSFMTTLSQKQAGNYQFDFLRPQHSLHQYFSRLVDQYTDLLQAPTVEGGKAQRIRLQELDANIKDKFHVLGRAKQRAEWVKYKEQQKQKKEEAEEKERLEYAQIDWHDFVVVETVTFTDADEQADFPPPTSLSDLQSASLEQKAAMSLQPSHMRIEEAMPSGENGYDYGLGLQEPNYGMGPPPAVSPFNQNGYGMPPPPQPPSAMNIDNEETRAIAERTEARERTQMAQAAAKGGATQPMRIRNDYVPRAKAKRQNVATSICPNCKQQIPVDEMSEHLRSKWHPELFRGLDVFANGLQLSYWIPNGKNNGKRPNLEHTIPVTWM